MENKKLSRFKTVLFVICLAVLFSCKSGSNRIDNDGAEIEEFVPCKDPELTVKTSSLNIWKGNTLIAATAKVESMKFIFEFDMGKLNEDMFVLSKKDNFTKTVLKFELSVDGRSIANELSEIKKDRKSNKIYGSMNDTSGIFYEEVRIANSMPVKITIPLYLLRGFKANKNVDIKIHVWQDYFLCDVQHSQKPGQSIFTAPDTLYTKLIDNSYCFTLKMPEIYKTDIICDSIILQHDKDWSPGGSDNTLFKSSYPDIFYSVFDRTYFEQSSSHVEKSTDTFMEADTISLYRYKLHEPFYLEVSDFDFLSKNDVLGDTLIDPDKIANNKTVKLKFGHVNRFYFIKKDLGKIN